jgi:cytoskeleton protein RodZ
LTSPIESPLEFGEELRRERELRDVSRDQLVAATRISIRQLEALESGRFEILPAKVFTRGFVRAIAAHLGLDPERYAAAFSVVYDDWQRGEAKKSNESQEISGQHVRLSIPRHATSISNLAVGVGIALVIGLAAFSVVFFRGRGGALPQKGARVRVDRSQVAESGPSSLALPPAIAAATVALPPAQPRAVEEALPVPAQPSLPGPAPLDVVAIPAAANSPGPAQQGLLRLSLSFREDCWTEVTVDGKSAVAELVRKGTSREFSGAKRFVLTFGNGSAVAVSLNGRDVSMDVPPGKVMKNLVVEQGTVRLGSSNG